MRNGEPIVDYFDLKRVLYVRMRFQRFKYAYYDDLQIRYQIIFLACNRGEIQ